MALKVIVLNEKNKGIGDKTQSFSFVTDPSYHVGPLPCACQMAFLFSADQNI